jgi:bifunctional UDP-N-acetylglucosamine pyrophosphorylase/glucosamine-1-phosphate N-acetyltransferase/UDP-N-acetylglucosamine pyrophosphorylase
MQMGLNNLGVIILAAGKGTRMRSDKAKVLHKVAGKSMVAHVIESAVKLAGGNVHVVVGHQAARVKEEVARLFTVNFAVQEQLMGTADAVKVALPGLNPGVETVLVLCGDVPLIQSKTLEDFVNAHKESRAKLSVLATDLDDPTGYGRIILDEQGKLLCIREEADADEHERKIRRVNAGIYCFDRQMLVSIIDEIRPENNQAEYYLTDTVEIANNRHERIAVITMDDPDQVMGVNTLEELAKAEDLIGRIHI